MRDENEPAIVTLHEGTCRACGRGRGACDCGRMAQYADCGRVTVEERGCPARPRHRSARRLPSGVPSGEGSRRLPAATLLIIILTFLPTQLAGAASPSRAHVGACCARPLGVRAIHGTVINRSVTPHRPVAHVPVALQARRDGRVIWTVEGQTDARGSFALTAPSFPPGASYAVLATYKRVSYEVTVDIRHAGSSITVPVYDTTTSDAGILAMRVLIGVRRQGNGLAVIEQWLFTNGGSLTDVGAPAASFPLPAGATHVRASVQSAESPNASAGARGDNVVVHAVLRPATGMNATSFHQVEFTFVLPGSANHPTLLIPTRYFIGSLGVFTLSSRLVAPGFTKTTLANGNARMPEVVTQAVPPGSTLAVGVDGPPSVAINQPQTQTSAVIATPFPSGLVVVMIELGFGGLLLLALLRRRPMTAGIHDRLGLQRERARLVEAIAELDLLHARGDVADDAYRRRRAAEKRRLLTVARQLGE